MIKIEHVKTWTYQYGDNKIELKSTIWNFELYINGELQATTKGKITFQFSSDIKLTAKLPSGEDVLAIKTVHLIHPSDISLFVGQQQLTPQ